MRSVTVRVQSEGEKIFDLGGVQKRYLIRCQISRSKTLYIVFQHKSLFNLVKDLFKWIEGLGRSVTVRIQSEGDRIFDLGGIRKEYLIRCQISRSKTLYIVFQHKSLFNLVKDLFKWIEGLGRSVTVRIQSEGERIFDLGGIRKKYLIRCQISRSKTLYIVFQHKSLFNLVKDLFKWIEGLGRSVTVRVQSEGGRIFDLGGIGKEYLIRCQISRSKTLYIMFQHKSLFNLVKDLIKWIEGLGRSVTVRVQSEGERIFNLGGIGKEYLIRCQISRSKTRYIVFQHKSLFNLVKDLFKWIEGLVRSVTVRVQSEGERIFDLGGVQKRYLIRCQISRSKTRYIVFQHKSLFNLVKDLFKWIEGLGWSVTVQVQSEGERIFDLGGIRKKYLIRCQISRSKTFYIAFQHKSLFNLVKDLFKWIEGLGRSVTVRVQSEGEWIFDLGGIWKEYLIRCQISRSKTLYIVFQHKSLFNLVKDLFKWIEGLGRSVTVRVQSEGEGIFDLGGIGKEYLIRCQISRSKTRYIVFQHKSLFNLFKDLFKWIEGLVRSVTVRVQSEGERIFDLGGVQKRYLIRCQISRSKTLYIVFQHKSLFNLVKDLFKWIEGLGRSVTVRVKSEGERIFDLGGIREKYLIRCQISRSRTRYIVFQHKSLFNLVKDLFKWIEGLVRSVTVRLQSEGERIFDLGGVQKRYLIRCQISRSKTRYIVFQHKSLFNLVKDLFKWIEGLVRSVTVRVQSEGERIFDLGGVQKRYLIRCQISRSKTRYIVFQHKSLFNLVKDLFKWIEGLGWSVTVQVQSEGERIFDLGGIRKKYLIRCQISRSKTFYIAFQHKSLFNLVKDLFKWIEGLGRSVTVRVQSEGEWIFDLGGIWKEYLIRCHISRSKTLYIVFQHKSLFNLVKDLFKWIEGLGRSVTVRVQSEGERIFDLGGIGKEYLIRCQISRSKTRYIVFQHKSLFNLFKDLFKWIEGLVRSVTVRVQSEGERIFDLGGVQKRYLIRCQISRSKTLYIVFQHKSLFNLVKDLFKWIEGLGRSVTVRVQSEGERIFDLGGIREKYLIRCQISRSRTRYIVFQHKSLFNLVKDLFKWIEDLGRSVTVRVQSEGERIFDLGGIRKEYLIRCQISRSKTRYIVFQHKSLFNLVKDLFKWIEGLVRSVTVRVQSEGERIFDLGGIRKKYLIRCQISRSKTLYIVFQHKSLFNLVKDLFKWIEGLGRSVTVRVQSEGGRIFDLGGIGKEYLIRCQISRSKTLYIVFQHKSLFNLVKDLFKWIEGLGRSVTVRVQSEGERIFDLGGIGKEYLIRCQISRSKTRYIVFQHKSLFNLVKDLFKWIEGLGRSVTVRVQSEGERILDLGGIGKEYLIRCQISRSKTLYIVFQHKSLFNLVKDLFKWIEGLGRSVTVRVQSEGERIFDLGGIGKEYLIRCQISRSKTRYIVFQHKSLFNLFKDLFKWIEGLVRSVTVRVQSEGERIFDLGGVQKRYLIRCQISRSKTRYIVFQHKSLFNLVKDLFKWIEGLGRSVTVRVQSEGERIFDLGGIRKKYLIRCQISRSKTFYIAFQHKSLFNLVKDLFKWIEGLGRSVTVRVQSEGERIFDLGGIGKEYLIRCQISRSKTLYIVFQHKSLFNLVKDLSKWIEGLGRSVTVRVQSEGERIFDLGGIGKEYLIRCQISRSKTRYIVFQHKSLFNLFKDLFKWIEGLVRSGTVRVQSEGERIFDLGGIREKYLIRCQISRSKTRYIVFQHKSLFNLVKDLFKWIEDLGRSVTVRVQSEG